MVKDDSYSASPTTTHHTGHTMKHQQIIERARQDETYAALLVQEVVTVRSLHMELINTPAPSLSYASDATYERYEQALRNFEHALGDLYAAVNQMWRESHDISSGAGLSLDGLMSCLSVHEWTDALSVIRKEHP